MTRHACHPRGYRIAILQGCLERRSPFERYRRPDAHRRPLHHDRSSGEQMTREDAGRERQARFPNPTVPS